MSQGETLVLSGGVLKKSATKKYNFLVVFEELWRAYNHHADFIIKLFLVVLYTGS